MRRVKERVSRDQSSGEGDPSPRHGKRWVQFNAFFMFLMLCGMMVVMGVSQGSAVVTAWCNCSFWMFGWWFSASVNTAFSTYCNQPFRKVWRIRATAIQPNNKQVEDSKAPRLQSTPGEHPIHHLPKDTADGIRHLILHKSPPKGTKLRYAPPHAVEQSSLRNNPHSFCILLTVRGVPRSRMFLRQISRVLTLVVFVASTGWLSSVMLLPAVVVIMLVTAVTASALLARFGTEAIIRSFVRLDACVHLPVASDHNAADLLARIIAVRGVRFELDGLLVLDGV
ncbi:hypothetical protein GP486_005371, partial [Trichoglossum hirsutum]